MSSAAVQSNAQITQLSDRLHELKGEAEALLSTLDRTSGELSAELRAHLEKHPYAVLAAAAGVGLVLGGGLPSPLARLVVLLGGRVGFELLSRELGSRVSQRVSNGFPTNVERMERKES